MTHVKTAIVVSLSEIESQGLEFLNWVLLSEVIYVKGMPLNLFTNTICALASSMLNVILDFVKIVIFLLFFLRFEARIIV